MFEDGFTKQEYMSLERECERLEKKLALANAEILELKKRIAESEVA